MKRIISAFTGVILLTSALMAQAPVDTDAFVSSDVQIYVKTASISKVLKTVNFIVNKLMDDQTRSQMLAGRDDFKNKTGIDLLNEASLKKNGIDTSRPFTFTVYGMGETYKQPVLMFLPINNEKEFPAKFNAILKKTSEESGMNFTTQKAEYNGVTIYQIEPEFFTAAFDGYFLMATASEVIQKAIDLRKENADALVLDENYKHYLAAGKNGYDINLYYSKKFMESMNSSSPYGGDGYGILSDAAMFMLAQYGEQNSSGAYDVFDYMSMGLGLEDKKIRANCFFKLVEGANVDDAAMGMLASGINKNTLSIDSADITMSMGIDFKKLDSFCKDGNPNCYQYTSFKQSFMESTKIDFEKDFVPYFTGTINLVAIDSGAAGGFGDIVLFLPMTDAKKTEAIWNKLKKVTQDQYGPQKMFGEEKVEGKKAFWFTDNSGMKYYVVFDSRGFYFSNSAALVKTALKSGMLDKAPETTLGKIVSDKTFIILNIKKSMLLQQMALMAGGGNPMLGGFLGGIGSIMIHGEKSPDSISIDAEVELKGK